MCRNILIIYTAACAAVHGWNQSHPTGWIQCGEVIPSCLFCWYPLQNMVWPSLFSLVIKDRLPGECSPMPADSVCRISLGGIISSVTCCLLVSEAPRSPALLVGCLQDLEIRRETFSAVVLPVASRFPAVICGSTLLLWPWPCGYYLIPQPLFSIYFCLICLVSVFYVSFFS